MLFAALLLLVPQQSGTPPTDSVRQDTLRLGSIVIRESRGSAHRYAAPWSGTATKVSTPLRDTPASVSVITSALIRERAMLSMADALRYAPGITMGQGEGHRDAPTIRGNSSTADFFVDGVRDDVQYFRDLYNVERVEALGGSNAMTFGRGGGGGVVNRVTKRATFDPVREATLEGGAFGHGRVSLDLGGIPRDNIATRLNAMYQSSEGFRDQFENTRVGVSPQATLSLSPATQLRAGGEFFSDARTVDRGMPSFQGRPSSAPLERFFGNPDSSYSDARVIGGDVTLEHRFGAHTLFRTSARGTLYDKFYQNVYPGSAVDASGTTVNLAAYNNDTYRANVFGQGEAIVRRPLGRISQTLLFGVEVGQQSTDNVRKTGYFNGTTTSQTVAFDAPTDATPVEFRPSASDADNHVRVRVASLYAQDQLWLTSKLQAIVGARVERFDLDFHNHRSTEALARTDNVLSPRAGVVFKPVEPVSLYSNVSISYLPSAGDQFASLTPSTQALEPERFTNKEAGIKWDVRPALSLTAALYELDRTNTAAPSALDPGVYVQTGSQSTRGIELTLNGRVGPAWDVAGAFTSQRAKITSQTTAAPEGAVVPLVPRTTASLWNRLRVSRGLAIGLGALHQSDMFAAIDNTVTLPGFWRFDAAAFVTPMRRVAVQVNAENILDRRYFATSHGNNNIMPGAPRTLKVSLATSW